MAKPSMAQNHSLSFIHLFDSITYHLNGISKITKKE